jgi:crotonobetainyl-CoA:carnitine CoA-transferase CaiB-like acyl-CoA transferase
MTTAEGNEIFKKLLSIGDVVLENYSPRVMANFRLDYPQLQEINPYIIMVSLPAMGRTGPDKDFIAFGQTIDCMSGMAYLTGYPGEEPMLQSGLAYGDPLSGMNAALAIVMALRYRRRSGKGMHIELSQVEGVISFNADSVMDYTMNRRVRGRMGNNHPSMAPHGYYRCRGEDAWVAVAIDSDETWQAFCEVIGQPPWSKDARFSDMSGRYSNQDELDKLIETWTLKHGHYEVMHILQETGIPAGPVLDAKELLEDPHLNRRGLFQMVNHPEAGVHPEIGAFARFSKTPIEIRMPAPCLGEHNRYVFGQLLGMSSEEISHLEKQRIIGTIPSEAQQGSMY